jgi:transposase-like protein
MARTKKKALARSRAPGASEPAKTPGPKKSVRKRSTKKVRKHRRYSDAERSRILTAARKQKLTGAQVQKRFGVTIVTYYSWRRKAGVKRGRRSTSAVSTARSGSALGSQLRSDVQARIRALLPDLVRVEVDGYLNSVLGSSGKRRGRV